MLVGMEILTLVHGSLSPACSWGCCSAAVPRRVLWARSRPSYAAGDGRPGRGDAGPRPAQRPDARPRPPPRHLAGPAPASRSSTCGADRLRRETQSLSTALRKPQVRGRWGEMHLRRAVELAGLVDRCDFTEQVRRLDDGAQRPDLVVHLVGGRRWWSTPRCRSTPTSTPPATDDDDRAREAHLAPPRPAAAPARRRAVVQALLALVPETPEFVVLFVPAESFLAAALDADRDLHRVRREPARSCWPRPPR